MTHRLIVALALGLVACKSDPPAPSVTSAQASAVASATTSFEPIVVSLDGEKVGSVAAIEGKRQPLAELLDGTSGLKPFNRVVAQSRDGRRRFDISDFSTKFAGFRLEIYLHDNGKPSVGIFKPVAEDAAVHVRQRFSKPRHAVTDVATIELHSEAAPPERQTRLVLRIGSDKTVLSEQALEKLPTTPAYATRAEGGKGHNNNWQLRDVIASKLALARVARVTVVAARDAEVVYEAAALLDPKRRLLLRVGGNSKLVLEEWREGDKEPHGKLRRVKKLVITEK